MAFSASWRDIDAGRRAPADSARLHAFDAVRRHSRRVRLLRVLLPLAGCLAVAAFVVKAHLSFPGDMDLSAASLSVTRNSVIMDRPHMTGFDGDRREYSLLANRAIQPLLTPAQVRLEGIEAKITATGRGTTTITAESGDYDHEKSFLRLHGAIVVDAADGYRLRMVGADVDFAAETMLSEKPVAIGYGESEITGERLSVAEGGKRIIVEGRVRTVLMPPKRATPVAGGAQ